MENNNCHTICLDNKRSGRITSVAEVKNFSETEIKIKLKDTSFLNITGANLRIVSFDNSSGILTFVGSIQGLKYQEKSEKFLKKVFK